MLIQNEMVIKSEQVVGDVEKSLMSFSDEGTYPTNEGICNSYGKC